MAQRVIDRGLTRRDFIVRAAIGGGMAAATALLRPVDVWGAVSHRPLDPVNPARCVASRNEST